MHPYCVLPQIWSTVRLSPLQISVSFFASSKQKCPRLRYEETIITCSGGRLKLLKRALWEEAAFRAQLSRFSAIDRYFLTDVEIYSCVIYISLTERYHYKRTRIENKSRLPQKDLMVYSLCLPAWKFCCLHETSLFVLYTKDWFCYFHEPFIAAANVLS